MTPRGRLAVSSLVFAAAAIGCQLLVSSDVPSFRCSSTDSSACPAGMTCDISAGACVTAENVPDASDDESAPVDAPPDRADAPTPLAALGEVCVVDRDCESKLCGPSAMLTTTIVPASSKPICTKTCCTSADCPTSFVCFAPGTGGNYCVPAEKAQREAPASGGGRPGAGCSSNAECRSGYCLNSRCLDTCCLPGDCASGTVCRIKTINVPTPGHDGWVCAPPETGATNDAGATCAGGDNGLCKTDTCINNVCRPPCCSKKSCVDQGFPAGQCTNGTSGSDSFRFCLFTTSDSPTGAACTENFQCQTRACDAELRKCVEVCCQDSDCSGGEVCRPSPTGTPLLRCVKPAVSTSTP